MIKEKAQRNALHLRAFMQSRRVLLTVILAFVFLSLAAPLRVDAGDSDEAFAILDKWTSTRWGDDNLSWVVHYPKELVEPWVRAEAEKRKYRADQTDKYRKAFEDELKIDSSSAFLLSVHAYGAAPLKLAPLSQNIVLIDSSGKRIKPIAYEKKLDNMLSGLVQGFVFFPKQKDTNFRVAVKGLKSGGETLFTFLSGGIGADSVITTQGAGSNKSDKRADVRTKDKNSQKSEKEVIVKIPTVSKPQAPSVDKPKKTSDAAPDFEVDRDIYAPTKSPASQDSAEKPLTPAPPETPAPTPKKPKLSAKGVLDIYLKAWIQGDTDQMYKLLSNESRARISKELFARDVTSGGFREALAKGYKVSWSDRSAKVTVSQKVLLMRTTKSRVIRFTEEDGSASVEW